MKRKTAMAAFLICAGRIGSVDGCPNTWIYIWSQWVRCVSGNVFYLDKEQGDLAEYLDHTGKRNSFYLFILHTDKILLELPLKI